ncbi:RhoGAP-domain-containing protein [Basidiobolus meristosporus CBS 931.73]|uniref:RhoGAP-domain-containing protein n=1 Tax=Basidiobolus meristosporus CBS 931.73 TaxID=1314790 RepID=A0A1Y1YXW6_9FUNG|nr:RhoGAP-domain-containing protein [Basidiobolus meristosporus CBS 931.73]|eukprot:ORY02873.1 RhoGAP-domain-containing protein [Basidiobolus meristosporus CBS 931.73]
MTVEQSAKSNRWGQLASLFRGPESAKLTLRDRWKFLLTRKQSPAHKQNLLHERACQETLFGVPLGISIKYASAVVNLGRNGGYLNCLVPIVVAECGGYLKDHAVNTEGIFRVNGSSKRVRQLQDLFNTGPAYGMDIAWEDFSIHDVANLFRRYLNCLPEPVISPHLYLLFRKAYSEHQDSEDAQIMAFQSLLPHLPRPNQILLLYLVNLLAYFAERQETTRMNAGNLATIFQPCVLAHPSHLFRPEEYRYSSLVVEHLIKYSNRLKVPPRHSIPLPPHQSVVEYDYTHKVTKTIPNDMDHRGTSNQPPLSQLRRSLSLGKRRAIRKSSVTVGILQNAPESSGSCPMPAKSITRSVTLPGKHRRRTQEL